MWGRDVEVVRGPGESAPTEDNRAWAEALAEYNGAVRNTGCVAPRHPGSWSRPRARLRARELTECCFCCVFLSRKESLAGPDRFPVVESAAAPPPTPQEVNVFVIKGPALLRASDKTVSMDTLAQRLSGFPAAAPPSCGQTRLLGIGA